MKMGKRMIIVAMIITGMYQYTIAAPCNTYGKPSSNVTDTVPTNRYIHKRELPATTQQPVNPYNPSNPVNPLYPNNQSNPAYPNSPAVPLYPNNPQPPVRPMVPAPKTAFPTAMPLIPSVRPVTPVGPFVQPR